MHERNYRINISISVICFCTPPPSHTLNSLIYSLLPTCHQPPQFLHLTLSCTEAYHVLLPFIPNIPFHVPDALSSIFSASRVVCWSTIYPKVSDLYLVSRLWSTFPITALYAPKLSMPSSFYHIVLFSHYPQYLQSLLRLRFSCRVHQSTVEPTLLSFTQWLSIRFTVPGVAQ